MVILLYTLLDSRQGGLQAASFHIQHIMKDAEVALRKHCQLHNRSRSPPYSAACWQGVTASSESLFPTIERQRHADDEGIILSADNATDLAIRHAGFH